MSYAKTVQYIDARNDLFRMIREAERACPPEHRVDLLLMVSYIATDRAALLVSQKQKQQSEKLGG